MDLLDRGGGDLSVQLFLQLRSQKAEMTQPDRILHRNYEYPVLEGFWLCMLGDPRADDLPPARECLELFDMPAPVALIQELGENGADGFRTVAAGGSVR